MINWEKLNAYTDSELDPQEAAKVAQLASQNVQVAQKIAQLTQLKATLSTLKESYPGTINLSKKRRFPWLSASIIAASIALITVSFYLFGQMTKVGINHVVSSLENYHTNWSVLVTTGLHEPNRIQAKTVRDAARKNLIPIPDLSGLGLTFSSLFPINHSLDTGWHVGYIGTKGCRVSVFAINNDIQKNGSEATVSKKIVARSSTFYQWQVASTTYYLTASSMSEQRLAIVKQALQLKTQQLSTHDAVLMANLKQAYHSSVPCIS